MYHIIPLCCICSKSNKTLKILNENDLELLDMLSTQLFDFENLKTELPLYMCDVCHIDLEKIKVFQKLFNDSVTQMLGYIEQLKYDEYFCIPIIKIDTKQDIQNIQNEFIIRNQPKIYLEKVSAEEINKYCPQNQESYDETSIVPDVNDEIIEITCDLETNECLDNNRRSFVLEKTNGQLKQLINESETNENVKNIWDKLLDGKTKNNQPSNDPLEIIIEKKIAQVQAKTIDKPAVVLPKRKNKRTRRKFGKGKNKKNRLSAQLDKTWTKNRGKNKKKRSSKQSNVLDEALAKNYLEICEVETNERGEIKIVRASTQSIVLDETLPKNKTDVLDEICEKTNELGENKIVLDEAKHLDICDEKTVEGNNKRIRVSNVSDEICAAVETNEGGLNKRLRSSNVLKEDNAPPPNILINNIRHKFASILDKNPNEENINLDIVKNEPLSFDDILDESNIKQEIYYE